MKRVIILITFIALPLFGCFSGSYTYSYTGTVSAWHDHSHYPIRVIWKEAKDSSWAEMYVLNIYQPIDTITFKRLPNKFWQLTHYKEIKELQDFEVYIKHDGDLLDVGIGLGIGGDSYDLKKDPMTFRN